MEQFGSTDVVLWLQDDCLSNIKPLKSNNENTYFLNILNADSRLYLMSVHEAGLKKFFFF